MLSTNSVFIMDIMRNPKVVIILITMLQLLIAVCLLINSQALVAQPIPCQSRDEARSDIGEGPRSFYYRQWHLTGYAQNTAPNPWTASRCANTEHLRVEEVWNKYKGEGIYIAIVDGDIIPAKNNQHIAPDERYVLHEDLIENLSIQHSVDYTPSKDSGIAHGVEVAGIAAARGYNGIGVRGVAPLAKIISVSLTSGFTVDRLVKAMTHHKEITAVYNNSWAYYLFEDLGAMSYQAMETGLREGFYGKGSVYVWGAGNRYRGSSANFRSMTNSHGAIAVCAVDYHGMHSSHPDPEIGSGSEAGANLWVCGFSGDYESNTYDDIVTTTSYKRNTPHIYHQHPYGRYFDILGTSAAAPMVSGVVALMREANPNLGWRDVKLILAATARKTDATDKGWLQSGTRYGDFNKQYHFNHKYGFGLVDGQAAVEQAEDWVNVPARVADTVVEDIPTATIVTRKLTRTIAVESDIDFIEYIDATIDLKENRGHSGRPTRYIGIRLLSPSGTLSILASDIFDYGFFGEHHLEVDTGGGDIKWRYGSARHLGEAPSGEWQLMIERDKRFRNQSRFGFQGWELRIRGFKVELAAEATAVLSELNVNETTMTLSLSGAMWKADLQKEDLTLKNAPPGLSISKVIPTSDTQVIQLKLNFDGILAADYNFQVEATTGSVSNLARALVSNDIELARITLKTNTIPKSMIGTAYHYTISEAFTSLTDLSYTIELVDENDNILTSPIPGITIDGHTLRGTPGIIATHRLRVTATRTDGVSRTEYFSFSVDHPPNIELQLKVFLEGLLTPKP